MAMEEFVFVKQTRLLKWNVKLPDECEEEEGEYCCSGHIVFFIRRRFNDGGFSHSIPFAFPFNLQRLSSSSAAASLQQLVHEAVVSTQQLILPENRTALANTVSTHLLNNYRFGHPFSPPRLVVVVEVNHTLVLNCGGVDDDDEEVVEEDSGVVDEECFVLALRNLLRVSVMSVLEPSDVSEPSGLFLVPGLDSFETCGGAALAAAEDDDDDDSIGMCSICLEGYSSSSSSDDCGKKMPCSHVFHGDCIAQRGSCPLCRYRLS